MFLSICSKTGCETLEYSCTLKGRLITNSDFIAIYAESLLCDQTLLQVQNTLLINLYLLPICHTPIIPVVP